MNNLKNNLFVIFFLFSFFTSFSQNWKTIPDVFDTQCKTSYMKEVNRGSIQLQSLPSNSKRFWVVYSDRANNRLKNRPNGSNNGSVLNYMEALLVKDVKDNWLQVYGYENEDEKGWIEAKYLLLSVYSLKTEGDVSVPRKAIILTSLDDMIGGGIKMDDVLEQKHYYSQPEPKKEFERGTPNSFTIMFVLKEQGGSVLLSNTDFLNENPNRNISKVYGWMPKANVTPWNSRVALEPSRSKEAIDHYRNQKLPGYKSLKKLETCITQNICDTENRFVEFRVEEIRANRMRKPILKPINKNIREIVSIAKNSSELGDDQIEIYNDLLAKLDRKSQMTNIIFAVDATVSMSKYFKSVASSITKIIKENERLNQHQLKFGLIFYRDYSDGSKAFSYEALTPEFEVDKILEIVNSTKCFSSPNDRDLEEAQYNGLIKGINSMNLDPSESNVVVLIGDCGNHKEDPEGRKLIDVINLFHEKEINLISFQVKNNFDDSYFTFNEDAQEYILQTADKIVAGKANAPKISWKKNGVNSYKLDMTETEGDFQNMFGRFIYAKSNQPMRPENLDNAIVETLSEYMKSVDKNIDILRTTLSGSGGPLIDTEKPPKGLTIYIQNKFNCSEKEAIDFLNKTEVTTKAYVAIDYNGNGVDAQVPVVFLTENERNNLVRSLQKLTSGDCVTTQEKKECLKTNLIEVCRSILGPKTSTETIEKLTMQEVWKLIIGIDFINENLKLKNGSYPPLMDIKEINNRDFRAFYEDFEMKSKAFCDKGYENENLFKSRRFDLFGSYFYWIPLIDLPGSK